MSEQDANNEKGEYIKHNLEIIDPTSKYYFKAPYMCDPKLPLHVNTNLPNKNGQSCSKLEMPNKKLLFYDNGGIDSYNLIIDMFRNYEKTKNVVVFRNNLRYYLKKLQNVFDGIAKLNENNIYHFDIKPENIVTGIINRDIDFKQLNIGDNVFRLIDFGLAHKFENNVLQPELVSTQLNFIRPLDIVYLSGLSVEDINYIIGTEYYDPENIRGLSEIKHLYNTYYDISDIEKFMKYLSKLNGYYDKENSAIRKKFTEQIFRTVDTFSLGCLLYYIYRCVYDISEDPSLRKIAEYIHTFVIYNKLMHYDPFERPLVNGPTGVAEKYRKFLLILPPHVTV